MAVLIILLVMIVPTAFAKNKEEIAKKLANPIAAMISLPLQLNYDKNIGTDDKGDRYVLNIQPVIPFSISADWNIISRTILPVTKQDDIFPGAGSQTGLGDVVQSVFFSPKEETEQGWILGAGPVFLLPTATDNLLGAEKWGAGPTAIALKQTGPWTYGGLTNHIWSFAGDDERNDVSATFIQPFLVYTTKSAITVSFNAESTYDWESDQWAIPFNAIVSKVIKVGNQLVSVGAGVRYWAESTDSGPEGLGARLMLTFIFPK
ncbi:MAG: transporter [Deltaproteobacteria bacterium]|nr:transporter [Deltaproteobacteria bacterium]